MMQPKRTRFRKQFKGMVDFARAEKFLGMHGGRGFGGGIVNDTGGTGTAFKTVLLDNQAIGGAGGLGNAPHLCCAHGRRAQRGVCYCCVLLNR